MVIESSTSFMR